MDSILESLKKSSEELFETTLNNRRYLHENPELSFNELNTSLYISDFLIKNNIRVINNFSGTSVIGILDGLLPGGTLGFRAEMDALPINEMAAVSFRSQVPGVMHACGHDIHSSILLSAAKLLQQYKDIIKGKIVFIFESGEEQLPGGAKSIIDSIAFQGNLPDKMIGFHILPELDAGKAGFKEERYMASGDEIYITVKGKGGHAALPQTLIDPIVIASNLIISLQQIVSRKAPPLVPSVLSFGKIFADGATNIIPDKVEIAGTFRTMDESWRKEAHILIEQIALNTTKSMGGICDIEIRKGYPSVYNNPELTKKVANLTGKYLGDENVINLEPRMTTDDFAYFSQLMPSVFFRLGTGFNNQKPYQLHNPEFIANEEILRFAPGLLVWLAIELNGKS